MVHQLHQCLFLFEEETIKLLFVAEILPSVNHPLLARAAVIVSRCSPRAHLNLIHVTRIIFQLPQSDMYHSVLCQQKHQLNWMLTKQSTSSLLCVRCENFPSVRWIGWSLARHVGCRRVVLLSNRRHSVSCQRHVADFFQSCRRHKKMSCRLECLNDTTFDDCWEIPDMSVIS